MGVLEAVIPLLIWLVLIAAAIWVVIWALGQIGVPLPDRALKLLWVAFGLIAFLMLARLMVGSLPAFPR